MTNPAWGTKRTCGECGKRFYDMARPTVACPVCGAPYKAAAPLLPSGGHVGRRRKTAQVAAAPVLAATAAAATVEPEEGDHEVLDDAELEDGEGTSALDDDAEADDEPDPGDEPA